MTLYKPLGYLFILPLMTLLYRPKVSGPGRIPRRGPAILASNHESAIDPFVVGLLTHRSIRWVAKAELWNRLLFRALLAAFGAVPIERGGADHDAVSRVHKLLLRGALIGIFPQGTCLPYRHRPFRRGAARLALTTGAPLIPIALVNTEKMLPPGHFRPRFPRARIVIGEPIQVEPQEATRERAAELTERLEQAVRKLREPYGEPAHAWID